MAGDDHAPSRQPQHPVAYSGSQAPSAVTAMGLLTNPRDPRGTPFLVRGERRFDGEAADGLGQDERIFYSQSDALGHGGGHRMGGIADQDRPAKERVRLSFTVRSRERAAMVVPRRIGMSVVAARSRACNVLRRIAAQPPTSPQMLETGRSTRVRPPVLVTRCRLIGCEAAATSTPMPRRPSARRALAGRKCAVPAVGHSWLRSMINGSWPASLSAQARLNPAIPPPAMRTRWPVVLFEVVLLIMMSSG